MNLNNDEIGAVRELISRMLTYYQTWEGTVVDIEDPLNRGRIKVKIPQIGWIKLSECPWVEPELQHGQVTPKKDVAVLVYFLNGNKSKPMYRGRSPSLKVSRLVNYATHNDVVLFEDDGETPDDTESPMYVVFHRDKLTIDIQMGKPDEGWTQQIDLTNKVIKTVFAGDDGYSQTIDVENKKIETKLSDTYSQTIDAEGKTIETLMGDGNSVKVEDKKITIECDDVVVNAKTVKVDSSQTVEIKGAQSVKVDSAQVTITGGMAKIGGTVAPTGSGALCGIPACLFTGAPHVGDTASGT